MKWRYSVRQRQTERSRAAVPDRLDVVARFPRSVGKAGCSPGIARRQSAGYRRRRSQDLAHLLQRLSAITALLTLPLAAETHLKQFSHKKHLELGNIAPVIANAIDRGTYLSPPGDERRFLNSTNPCMACHRGLDKSDRISAANMPRMADCLVCHNTIDPPDSCYLCHTKDSQLRPASHTRNFLDLHARTNSGLDLLSCAVCHGRKFTCLDCH
jgi:hypothetical protein